VGGGELGGVGGGPTGTPFVTPSRYPSSGVIEGVVVEDICLSALLKAHQSRDGSTWRPSLKPPVGVSMSLDPLEKSVAEVTRCCPSARSDEEHPTEILTRSRDWANRREFLTIDCLIVFSP
jgi:hypothetical protein